MSTVNTGIHVRGSMENLNLGSDESVIHSTQRLIINGTGYEAALTANRIILVANDPDRPQIEIPYAGIELAEGETNKLREPVIRITYSIEGGSARGIELIFIFMAAGMNVQNRDRCLTVLERLGVPVHHDPTPSDLISRTKRERMDAGTLNVDGSSGRPAVPEWTIYGPSGSSRNPLPEEPEPQSPLVTLIAMILIAAVLISVMIVPLPEPSGKQPWSKTLAKPTVPPTPEPVPSPVSTPRPGETGQPAVPAVTSAPETPPLLSGGVPGNGVWVKISYPGSYSGFLSAGGWRIDVKSADTQYYQLPVHDVVIDGFIEKTDGSGDTLDVGVYNGGVLVEGKATSSPRGVVELHVPVGPAIMNTSVSVATPQQSAGTVSPVVAITPAQYEIPQTGVWVHVSYPGEYSGYIRGNGERKDVSTSGDQFYQFSMKGGLIDGVLQKADRSVQPLSVEVYKDGKQIDLVNTTAPQGTVEIHTTIFAEQDNQTRSA
jgi:hypothetical protein